MSQPPPLLPLSPLPVLPVDYTVNHARPGIITVVGIVSIVIGSLGLLAGLVSGLYAVGFTIASAVSSSAAATVPAKTTFRASNSRNANVTVMHADDEPNAAELTATSGGLAPLVRQAIIAALSRKHPFNDEKRDRLHELLAKGGQEMFPAAN